MSHQFPNTSRHVLSGTRKSSRSRLEFRELEKWGQFLHIREIRDKKRKKEKKEKKEKEEKKDNKERKERNGWTDRQTDEHTDGHMDRLTDQDFKTFSFPETLLRTNKREQISRLEIWELNIIFPVPVPENGNGKIKKLSCDPQFESRWFKPMLTVLFLL